MKGRKIKTLIKVVLIEDDAEMRNLLRTLLEIEGFQVINYTQTNEREIREALRADRPDIVLLDVHLRSVNGIDILHHIRQDENIRGLQVIMTSGMEVSQSCLDAGADGFILKPYMPSDLIDLIRERLNYSG
jgi:DNA-binding response OmpR family regulator